MDYLINGCCRYIFGLFGLKKEKFALLNIFENKYEHKKEIDFYGNKNKVHSLDIKIEDFKLNVKIADCSGDTEEYAMIISTSEFSFGFFINPHGNIFKCSNVTNNIFEDLNVQQLTMLINSLEKLRYCYSSLLIDKNEDDYDQLLDYIEYVFNLLEE